MKEENLRRIYLGEVERILSLDIIIFIISMFAIVLNSILIFLNVKRTNFNFKSDKLLICLISIFDLFAALYIFVFQINKWTLDLVLEDNSTWCQVSTVFFTASSFSALLLTSLLSTVRYSVIVRKVPFNHKVMYLAAALMTITSFTVFVVISQLHGLVPYPSGWYCLPLLPTLSASSITYAIYLCIIFILTLFILPICYSLLALHYNNLIKEVYDSNQNLVPLNLRKNIIRLVIIVILYYLLIFPELLNVVLSMLFKIKRMALTDGITITLLFTTSILNPLFAMFLHDETREELYDMLGYGTKWSQLIK